jgi:hypothetical protein
VDWSAVIIAVAVGCAALATTFFTGAKGILEAWMEKMRRRVKRVKYADGIQRVAKFHALLENLKQMPFVDRVLVFVGRNCGGLPDPSKPYTVSCFYGWSQIAGKHPELAYNFPLRVDAQYMAMLSEVISKGKSTQTVSGMPDSQLKTYYQQEGVVQAVIHFLRLSDNDFLFLSTGSYQGEFTPGQMVQIELMVERVRSVMDQDGDE